MREIATVKVLGFYDRETDQYVFRENWILTVLGLIAGYPMGWALHRYVMKQIRIDMICFDNRIAPLSLLYAAVLTLLFGLIVNLAMRRRLRHIHMAEALKSGELASSGDAYSPVWAGTSAIVYFFVYSRAEGRKLS